jgi:hypothetical protein
MSCQAMRALARQLAKQHRSDRHFSFATRATSEIVWSSL